MQPHQVLGLVGTEAQLAAQADIREQADDFVF